MNKHWEYENGIYKLYFCQFYEEELVSELYYDEFEEDWHYNINIYKIKDAGYLIENECSVDFAKNSIEDMIQTYILDEINYFKDMLEKWVDK